MTPEDLGKLTIAEFEALVARVAAASQVYRDAMALFAGQQPSQLRVGPPPPGPTGTNLSQPAYPPLNGSSPDLATPERLEHLEEQRLVRERWLRDQRQNPERQALVQQFAHDGNGVEE